MPHRAAGRVGLRDDLRTALVAQQRAGLPQLRRPDLRQRAALVGSALGGLRKGSRDGKANQSSKGRAAGSERDRAGQTRPEGCGGAHDLALRERREGGGLCGDGALGGHGELEVQLVSVAKLGLELCEGAEAAQPTADHDAGTGAQRLAFLHRVGRQDDRALLHAQQRHGCV